jgi:membrane-bound metal-dependent hydrolase YbcI (DUF457 family)
VPVRSRQAVLGCLATVAVADTIILRRRPPWIVAGLFDHPAHLGTAGLVLLNLPPRSRDWAAGFLAGSLLPDLDHVPLAVSRVHRTLDDPRPVTHCLLAVAPVFVAARLTHGRVGDALRGAAAGTLAHFARDLAVGTGVALFQPLLGRSLRVPYPGYAAALAGLAARAAARARRPTPASGSRR